jgi:FKBP-type peptidyl-prolyl cis-trans isomerase 2
MKAQTIRPNAWLRLRGLPLASRGVLLLMAAFVVLALAACGGSENESDSGSDVDVPSTATPEATSEATANSGEGGRVAADGDQVQVHYTGSLDSGEVFDSSEGREPLPFTVGSGDVIAGFDDAVRGLAVGDSVTVRIEPGQAYGERREDLVFELPRSGAPDGLEIGDLVRLQNGAPAAVLEIGEESVRIDANHQLAGEALTFEIELVAVE